MTNVQRCCIGRDGDDIMSCWNVMVDVDDCSDRQTIQASYPQTQGGCGRPGNSDTDTDVSLFHMTGLHTQALWPFSHKQTYPIYSFRPKHCHM